MVFKLFNWTGKLDMTRKRWIAVGKSGLMHRPNVIAALSAAVLLISTTVAQGAFFDTAGQSARPIGMGEVFMASSGDAAGFWYNPAGLASIDSRGLGISYGVLNPSVSSSLMKYQVGYMNPLGSRAGLGIGVSGLGGVDDATEMVVSGAFGYAVTEALAIGANAKIMNWSVTPPNDPWTGRADSDLSKLSFSLDVSATYALRSFTTGLYVKDAIMPNISESGDDGGQLPIEVGIGLMSEFNQLVAEADVATVNGQTIIRAGGEYSVLGSNLKLRGGAIYGSDFEDDTERTDINLGLGYAFRTMIFDYAYNLPMVLAESGGRHYVSFGFSF